MKPSKRSAYLCALLLSLLWAGSAWAHGVGSRDEAFLANVDGLEIVPFMYLGAKHMVTGYDHLAFLAGVIFFLYRIRDIAVYVTLFAVGHSLTLLLGVLGDIQANPFLIDAIVGLSVAYKGFDNLGGFRTLGIQINQRAAVFVFGLFHGFGLATKLQGISMSSEGLVGNIVAFNVGVELGQFTALLLILTFFDLWRATGRFLRDAFIANSALVVVGLVLTGYQLTGYFVE